MSFAHKWCFTKERWYGNCKKVIVYLILLAFLLCAFWGTLSGKEIVDYIEADGIEEIVIKKTLEDGNGIEDYCTFKLRAVCYAFRNEGKKYRRKVFLDKHKC